MANLILNKLYLPSPADAILEFIAGDKEAIDFDKIKSMPRELAYIQAPTRIVGEKDYDKALKLFERLSAEEDRFGALPLTQALSDKYNEQYGADNWYKWRIQNWGVKWNASDSFVMDNCVYFLTPWIAPIPLLKHLSRRFPSQQFLLEYADATPDCCGQVLFKKGQSDQHAGDEDATLFVHELWEEYNSIF